jgi:hypothetical protein
MGERLIDVAVVARVVNDVNQEQFTLAEAACRAGLCEATIRKYLRKGLIRAEIINGCLRFNASDIDEFVRPRAPVPVAAARIPVSRHSDVPRRLLEPPPIPKILVYPFRCGVYFFQCQGFIKIGIARNPDQRLAKFSLYNPMPVTMAHFIPTESLRAARRLEWSLHQRFAHARHVREWFRQCPELDIFIMTDRLRTQVP